MGSGGSVQQKEVPGSPGRYRKATTSRSMTRFRGAKGESVQFHFQPNAFVNWMESMPYFRQPGILHQAATMRKKMRQSAGSMMKMEELLKTFQGWDDLHFYGLVKEVDPKFSKSDVLDLDLTDEKSGAVPIMSKSKAKIGFKCDPSLFADFSRLIKLVLLVREENRISKGKEGKIKFDPKNRFGGQDIEDLRDELEIFSEFPEDMEELKENCSKMIQRLSESYLEQETLQSEIKYANVNHDIQLMEVKDAAEKDTQQQMRSLDERYKNELEEKEKAYQKMVDKYTKMKMKYKKSKKKNKFLHQNNHLGMFKGKEGAEEDEEGNGGEEWREKAAQLLSEREEEILNLQNEIYELKKGQKKEGKKKASTPSKNDGKGEMHDAEIAQMIKGIDGSTDIEEIKDVMKELATAREKLQESLDKSRDMVSDLEEKLRTLGDTGKKKERQLLRDNATMMRQVMKLRTALQGANIAIPVTARSARGNKKNSDILKESKKITDTMSRAHALMENEDDTPAATVLREEISRRMKQIEYLALQVCRWKASAFGCVRWVRLIAKKKSGRPGSRRADRSGRPPKTSRGLQNMQTKMEILFAQQKAEISAMLKSAGGSTSSISNPLASATASAMDRKEKQALLDKIAKLEKANLKGNSSSKEAKKLQNTLNLAEEQKRSLAARVKELEGMLNSKANNKEVTAELQSKISELNKEKSAAKTREAKLKEENESLEQKIKELEKNLSEMEKKLEGARGTMEAKVSGYMVQMEEAKKGLEEMSAQLEERESKMEDMLEIERKKLARVQEDHKKDMRAFEVKKTKELKAEMEDKMKKLQAKTMRAQEAFKEERLLRIKYHNMIEDMKGKIRVYCRIRPMSKSETKRGDELASKADDKFTIGVRWQARGRDNKKVFSFDEVFGPISPQAVVYENTSNLIQSAYDGYNVCIFAYGQTGTGKTYTMYGEPKNPGIAPRAIETLFECVAKGSHTYNTEVTCYMVELYKSALQDLLNTSSKKPKLKISKNAQGTVEVQNAVIRKAKDAKELMMILDEGNKKRVTSSTKMNAGSSRSHLILSILVCNTNKRSGVSTTGKLSLVDLAGCERASKTGANAQQLKEAQSINQSLSALGNVIAALSTGSKHVPYRSHVLTNLMSDSLGGNAKTLMFVNVSPSAYNADETINALNYATRVKMVKNAASKTVQTKAMKEQAAMIKKLQAQLDSNK